jgi:predicted ATPase/DNA-binding winged helix-turn-helix (wHTH) protein
VKVHGHDIAFGPFRLDMTHGHLWRETQMIALRPRTRAMLRYLVEHSGRLVTKAELRQHVWAGTHVTDTVLRVSVQEIRAALGDMASAPRYLETVGRQGYRFLRGEALDVSPPLTSRLIVGRQGEVEVLEGWFQRAAQGARQLVLVSGEAGVGKTTVVDLFVARLVARSTVRMARGQCVEQYGEGEPYLPVLEALRQLGRGPSQQEVVSALRQYAPMWLVQLPGLVSEAEWERLQRQVQGATSARMLREFAEVIDVLTAETPLVLVLEDLQWSDPATVALLAYVAQRRGPARLLVLGTYRPVEVMLRAHPLRGVVQELRGRGQAVDFPLEYLPAEDVTVYMTGRLGGPVAVALTEFVHERTDGNALFMVNIVEYLVQQDSVALQAGQWTLREGDEAKVAGLPEELRQFLMRRIELLTPEVRRVLEIASVAGEAFSAATVAAGAACSVEDVESVCEALVAQHYFLVDTGLTVWPDGTRAGLYRFQHALYQQVLYEQLGMVRRVQLHRCIGDRLEVAYGVQATEIAAQLAVHFERGGATPQAVHYWHQAGENAARRNAHQEALGALRKGLSLLATLPDSTERAQQELALQLTLGELVMAVQGRISPEANDVYTRAHALCQHVGDSRQHIRALWGLMAGHHGLGRLRTAEELARQLFHLAQRQSDLVLLRDSLVIVGGNALHRGDFVTARALLEQSLEIAAVPQSATIHFAGRLHPRILNYAWLLRPLWALGYADQAQQRCQEALTLAHQLGNTPSLALIDQYAMLLFQYCRDPVATYAHANALMTFATTQGLPHRVEQGRILLGWALAMQGDAAAGVQQLHQGLAAHRNLESPLIRPYRLSLLAEAYGQLGQAEMGLQVLDEALTLAAATEERWWEAELHRLKGALLLQLPNADVSQVAACFQQALDIARSQQAKSLELRAAVSLSRLWQQQGQRIAARELLAPIYGWFTEGFDTADLQGAKALLDELEK